MSNSVIFGYYSGKTVYVDFQFSADKAPEQQQLVGFFFIHLKSGYIFGLAGSDQIFFSECSVTTVWEREKTNRFCAGVLLSYFHIRTVFSINSKLAPET